VRRPTPLLPLAAALALAACSPDEPARCAPPEVRVSAAGEVSIGGRVLLTEPWEETGPLQEELLRIAGSMLRYRQDSWSAGKPMEALRVRADDAAPYLAVARTLACARGKMAEIGRVVLAKEVDGVDTGLPLRLGVEIGLSEQHFAPDRLVVVRDEASGAEVHQGGLVEPDAAVSGLVIRVLPSWTWEERRFQSERVVRIPPGSAEVRDADFDQERFLWIAAPPALPWRAVDVLLEDAVERGTSQFRFDVLAAGA
jgi:hypothetical protein